MGNNQSDMNQSIQTQARKIENEFIYDYFELNEDEKTKVINLIKMHIDTCYATPTIIGVTNISIPKYILLERSTVRNRIYFNVATAMFILEQEYEDSWEYKQNCKLKNRIMRRETTELYNSIITHIMKYNTLPVTIDFNYELYRIGSIYRCCDEYKNMQDKLEQIYGRLPSCFNFCEDRYPSIQIKILQIYNLRI